MLRNAREASPSGAEVVVTAGVSKLDRTPSVVITVSDSGVGMDVRTRERALAGFFTTKVGGTG